ncbi:MAG: hypothetical protein DRQ49_06845 [Gammaproteobacteria bacterium]|nr:MAG: hypothetical protein DRQ41_11670 [Gammaproteobacteria bacterium]RKZ40927.1 MAG: hypothetical protein DRQ49_06845 [Gammaproteobacteria bacterium]RKZ75668.1 MAG: hypothetical protein DRQ57_06540 [Gammaproteobacteria bacterium]
MPQTEISSSLIGATKCTCSVKAFLLTHPMAIGASIIGDIVITAAVYLFMRKITKARDAKNAAVPVST